MKPEKKIFNLLFHSRSFGIKVIMQLEVVKYSLGTDVSEKELEVCFKELLEDQSTKIKGSRKFANTLSGFKSMEKWIAKPRFFGEKMPAFPS